MFFAKHYISDFWNKPLKDVLIQLRIFREQTAKEIESQIDSITDNITCLSQTKDMDSKQLHSWKIGKLNEAKRKLKKILGEINGG